LNLSNFKIKLKPYNYETFLITGYRNTEPGHVHQPGDRAKRYFSIQNMGRSSYEDKKRQENRRDSGNKVKSDQRTMDRSNQQILICKTATEPWKEWTPTNQSTKGEINLLPLMEEAPAPIYILALAGQADLDAKYDPYIKKIESQQKQLVESVTKNNKLQQVYQKEGEEGIKKRAIAESDKNKMVQQMGGTENLMNMSEADRKAAALKMASDIKSNPGMLSGNNNPGMNALMQKVSMIKIMRNVSIK
jgi:hypothetical protein